MPVCGAGPACFRQTSQERFGCPECAPHRQKSLQNHCILLTKRLGSSFGPKAVRVSTFKFLSLPTFVCSRRRTEASSPDAEGGPLVVGTSTAAENIAKPLYSVQEPIRKAAARSGSFCCLPFGLYAQDLLRLHSALFMCCEDAPRGAYVVSREQRTGSSAAQSGGAVARRSSWDQKTIANRSPYLSATSKTSAFRLKYFA
jgi:hypothetical protein